MQIEYVYRRRGPSAALLLMHRKHAPVGGKQKVISGIDSYLRNRLRRIAATVGMETAKNPEPQFRRGWIYSNSSASYGRRELFSALLRDEK